MATKIDPHSTQSIEEILSSRASSVHLPRPGKRENRPLQMLSHAASLTDCRPLVIYCYVTHADTAIQADKTGEIMDFVTNLNTLCRFDRRSEAIDLALKFFNDLLASNQIAETSAALVELQRHSLPSSVAVSILGITRKAAHLRARKLFYDKAYSEISASKGRKYAKELLRKYK